MKFMRPTDWLLFTLFFCFSTHPILAQKQNTKAIPLIFETDMGNDIDDALALDMLYKYQDQQKIRLLLLSNNKNNKFSLPFIDLMNQWYGHPALVMAEVKDGANSEGDAFNYAEATVRYEEQGKPAFAFPKRDTYAESVQEYRRILSQEKDGSVVIASVGFSTNLARLLDSKPDQYSKLNGKELVRKKVKLLSMMAGNFYADTTKRFMEYNVDKDVPAARKVFAEWPTAIAVSPYELGDEIKFPATAIETLAKQFQPHPLAIAYASYQPMPYDRSTWDLTSVLYAIEDQKKSPSYFNISKKGKVRVAENGKTFFTEDPKNGKHWILSATPEQAERIKNRFVELILMKPANK